jgi:uncharacterized phage protein (TIGR02218 family)
MKTRSIALATAQSAGSTTLAWCWKVTRADGFIMTVTNCARAFIFPGDGLLYTPVQGFTPMALSQDDTQAVANSQVAGALSDSITEDDFASGKWDGCVVEMFEVNYRDLTQGAMKLAKLTMGEINVTRSSFSVAVNGLTDSLQKVIGRLVTKTCPWVFGDPNTCRFDKSTVTFTGTLTGVADQRTFYDTSRTEADDYFKGGLITFTSGALEGQSLEVYGNALSNGAIVTYLQFVGNPAIGDTYTIVAGCQKRFTEDCRTKFNNGNNFGGFDHLPGPDAVLGLGGTEGTDIDS